MIIPIKLKTYEELFYEFDNRPATHRGVRDEINVFIQQQLVHSIKKESVELTVTLECERDLAQEAMIIKAISNYYQSCLTERNQIIKLATKRLLYYLLISFVLFGIWYVIKTQSPESFFSLAIEAGFTAVLWQVMTLIFIESQNFKIKSKIIKLLAKMDVKFNYES